MFVATPSRVQMVSPRFTPGGWARGLRSCAAARSPVAVAPHVFNTGAAAAVATRSFRVDAGNFGATLANAGRQMVTAPVRASLPPQLLPPSYPLKTRLPAAPPTGSSSPSHTAAGRAHSEHWPRVGRLEGDPVTVPAELLAAFRRASLAPAPFAVAIEEGVKGVSLADHCLQVATEVLQAPWVPDQLRRDMVVMAVFHDVYYNESPTRHGELAAEYLRGRIDDNVLELLASHTDLCMSTCAQPGVKFGAPTVPMLCNFHKLDKETVTSGRRWLPLEFFLSAGFFNVDGVRDT